MKPNNKLFSEAPVAKVFIASIAAPWRGEKAVRHITQVEHELRVGVHVKYAGRFADAMQGGAEFSSTGVNRLIDPPDVLEHPRIYVDKKRLAKKPLEGDKS